MCVFLDGAKLVAPNDWAAAIRSQFDMELDSDFDVREHSGFLPCQYGGVKAGFEYFRGAVADEELESPILTAIGGRDVVISFVTHSDTRGLVTSVIASAVLCSLVDGVLWDTEANELLSAGESVAWAKELEASVRAEL